MRRATTFKIHKVDYSIGFKVFYFLFFQKPNVKRKIMKIVCLRDEAPKSLLKILTFQLKIQKVFRVVIVGMVKWYHLTKTTTA